jgi:SAM-dependent methyltransferase
MMSRNNAQGQKSFWEHAGEVGYGSAMYSSPVIERHIVTAHWNALVATADALGLGRQARVLELGCGDGEFSERVLSPRFRQVDAFDYSESAIEHARLRSRSPNVTYHVADLASYEFKQGDSWDAAFLKGFLHHVKEAAPAIVARLARVCPRIILLEPNGDNMVRKALELTPGYRRAGEESFRLRTLLSLFRQWGYAETGVRRITLIPPFLPPLLFPLFEKLERIVENNAFLSRSCSTYVIGFQKDPE